jgi:hypothetical protein
MVLTEKERAEIERRRRLLARKKGGTATRADVVRDALFAGEAGR